MLKSRFTHHASRILLLLTLAFLASCSPNTITGIVLDESGKPLPDAIVRAQTTTHNTTTDENGRFTLRASLEENAYITAWVPGYYIAGTESNPGDEIEIHLETHTAEDNADYEWLPSTYYPGEGEDQGCAQCHSVKNAFSPEDMLSRIAPLPMLIGEPLAEGTTLPVDEWLLDAHSQSARNPRFLTMYTGQDIHGNQSQPTRYVNSPDYGFFPLRPDPEKPYYGPGYKLDFPDTDGNCAACHTPLAAIDNAYGIDPTTVTGIATEGISCDFCHKIWDVRLDPVSGLPLSNMPGVLAYTFRRPPDDHQLFIGPLDDVAPGEDTYSPLQNQSQFCAPCHFSAFWDTPIYNSFGEWLESPYSDPERAKTAGLSSSKTCQDCHMPRLGNSHFVLPEAGGLERDPNTIFSHKMPGAADTELLQNALTMKVNADQTDDTIVVEVELVNDKTGHHIPTDSPLRHLILLVEVTDENGEKLTLLEGNTIPEWGGVGNSDKGYYAGLPGTAYAKILEEMWTEISPSGAYWNPTRILSDNRIPAMRSDTTTYVFQTSEVLKTSEVSVRLLFRRAFIELMEQKGWDDPDIVMESETIQLP
ncbi:MAG: carboxypeptidase regulatory-like domain-containing protein [Anaerolineae bacterium]|jgi:mono/diheme cytochrome c family protein|nr:carboxypeptidase regulatory-like domain-containing protein [Anaerolineae bacterium]MBT6324203.1 carboxypeptidase regulatory-like domain-containing protein [Anaerolineae bacterium]